MSLELNAFDQYDQAENRLTHALGVTLARSRGFQASFLKELAGGARLGRDAEVTLQMAKGRGGNDGGEKLGIPDLAITDEDGGTVIVEAKLGSALNCSQLASHEASADRNGLKVVTALAITGRDRDKESLAKWVKDKRLRYPWRHVSWQEVYRLVYRQAAQYGAVNSWLRELRDYMEIMAAQLDEDEMGADVKIIDFTGISEEMIENYSPAIAKRAMRSLMDELRADKAFLKDIGIPVGQPPRKRKAIKNSVRVWDFLSPVGDDDNFTKSHHFTVGLNPDRIEAMLTIPNASFGKFKKHVSKTGPEEFAAMIGRFMISLKQRGVLRAGGRPTIVIVQRRFRNMRQYAMDGLVEFDLRTLSGAASGKREPGIKKQPEWLEFCYKLITERSSNIQFQVGTMFYIDTCQAIHGKAIVDLIKGTFRAAMPVVQETGYGDLRSSRQAP